MDDRKGRTFLITGANTGIGLATATALAAAGGQIYLACRSADKGERAVYEVRNRTGNEDVFFLRLDLADLAQVRECADAFLARDEPLHVLINNAGVAGQRGVTTDGFELAFGVNHMGHFALTTALLGRLADSGPARVVTVSSEAHHQARGIDYASVRQRTRSMTGMSEYAVSKLANVAFTAELAGRLAGTPVTTYSLHPGVVASDIWRRVPWPIRPLMTARMLTTEAGARTSLYCATSPEVAHASGRFYVDCAERDPSPVATAELAAELWRRSEEWVAQ